MVTKYAQILSRDGNDLVIQVLEKVEGCGGMIWVCDMRTWVQSENRSIAVLRSQCIAGSVISH